MAMKISRRRFLETMTAGALWISAGSILSACGGVTRSTLFSKAQLNSYIFGLDDRDEKILQYASLAPSILNIQPWHVRIVDRRKWVISADPSRTAPAIDPENREILLSIGAFVENLSIAAAANGLRAEVTVMAQSPLDRDIVKVTFTHKPPLEYPLQRLELRRTVKKGFLDKTLTLETEYALTAADKDHFFYFPSGTEHAACIRDKVIEQYRFQLDRQEAQAEIIKWMRFSDEDAEKYLDGLTLNSMEIGGIPGWYLRHFAEPPDFLKPGYRQKSLDYIAALAREGAGWIVITSSDGSVSSLIEAGRQFERTALLARENKVAFHPMSQCLEEKTGTDQILSSHLTEFHPQFILRVGYLDSYPAPVSLRRPINWFLQT
jgi:hypothetical protein